MARQKLSFVSVDETTLSPECIKLLGAVRSIHKERNEAMAQQFGGKIEAAEGKFEAAFFKLAEERGKELDPSTTVFSYRFGVGIARKEKSVKKGAFAL